MDNTPKRDKQVPAEIRRVTDAVERIAKLSEELEASLAAGLRQDPSCPDDCCKEAMPTVCEYGENLRTITIKLARIEHSLQGMIDRLEV